MDIMEKHSLSELPRLFDQLCISNRPWYDRAADTSNHSLRPREKIVDDHLHLENLQIQHSRLIGILLADDN